MCCDDELEKAKKRLEESREKRIARRNGAGNAKEPKTLISGQFNEIEQKRIEKRGDEDE